VVTWKLLEADWASIGAYSTAMDVAIFGQMFLNRGTYGDACVLSPASVAEMTRDQIPGIGAQSEEGFFPEASWGLGWSVRGSKKSLAYAEALQSPQTFSHGGASGIFTWVDPVYQIVGAYFSVASEGGILAGVFKPRWAGRYWGLMACVDLLINAVTAAVVDA
jgi:CubicO group peptidase (beta-lactamase class C family)